MRVAIVVLTLALVSVLASSGLPWRSDPEVPRICATQQELASLRRELERVRASLAAGASRTAASGETMGELLDLELALQMRALRSQLAELRDDVQRLSERAEGSASADARRASGLSTAELGRTLDRVLQERSTPDPALAAELAASIGTRLPRGAAVRDVTCGPSLCRAQISYPDLAAYQTFVEKHLAGSEDSVWSGPALLELTTDPRQARGDVVGVAYLGRHRDAFTMTGNANTDLRSGALEP